MISFLLSLFTFYALVAGLYIAIGIVVELFKEAAASIRKRLECTKTRLRSKKSKH